MVACENGVPVKGRKPCIWGARPSPAVSTGMR